jgi:hypothetical protein
MSDLAKVVTSASRSQAAGYSSDPLWILIVRGLLWLAAWLVSGLLVYWLYITPIYRLDWTSTGGSLLFAFLAVLSAVGIYNNVVEAIIRVRAQGRLAVVPERTAVGDTDSSPCQDDPSQDDQLSVQVADETARPNAAGGVTHVGWPSDVAGFVAADPLFPELVPTTSGYSARDISSSVQPVSYARKRL